MYLSRFDPFKNMLFVVIFLFNVMLFGNTLNVFATEKIYQIIVVKSGNSKEYNAAFSGFENALKDAKINFKVKTFLLNNYDLTPDEIVQQVTRVRADLILTIGTKASQIISKRISDTPILFLMVINPEAQGLKSTHYHTNRNVSGVSLDIPIDAQFKIFNETIPNLKQLSVIYEGEYDAGLIEQAKKEAKKYDIELVPVEVNSEQDIPIALKKIKNESQLFWIIPNPVTINYSTLKYILSFGISNKFPICGLSEEQVKMGALLALTADYKATGKQAGYLAVDILTTGSFRKPVILSPGKTKLYINKRMADLTNIDIPVSVLSQAEKIYH